MIIRNVSETPIIFKDLINAGKGVVNTTSSANETEFKYSEKNQ